jgi:Protein of unknown function (DUF2786)
MGKNNRQRRAAKVRRRARSRPSGPHAARATAAPADTPVGDAAACFVMAVHAEERGDDAYVRRVVDVLAGEPPLDVAPEVACSVERHVAQAWNRGWQPADVIRVVDRERGQGEAELARCAIASQAASYEQRGARVAPEWMAQLERVGATRTWDPHTPYLVQLAAAEPERRAGRWRDALLAAVRTTSLLARLPDLPRLIDPPSQWRDGIAIRHGSLPAVVLERVRALLAKAESTTFAAEAEACTAKAQELMARHRIDRAVIEAAGHRGEEPVGRRLGVDDPYADAKAMLLANVADANGCRAVWSKVLGFTTVFGFADELDVVEELFTSLLVQATSALRRAGPKQDRYGRSRTTRFRRSFLVAYAVRIGQRLRETVDAAVDSASAEIGVALVPILTARTEATAAAAERAFPNLGSFSSSATDGEGWYAGTLFGDQVELSVAPKLTRRTA